MGHGTRLQGGRWRGVAREATLILQEAWVLLGPAPHLSDSWRLIRVWARADPGLQGEHPLPAPQGIRADPADRGPRPPARSSIQKSGGGRAVSLPEAWTSSPFTCTNTALRESTHIFKKRG